MSSEILGQPIIQYDDMDTVNQRRAYLDQAIAAVLKAGVLFIKAGAEVYRAEETINRLGKGIKGIDNCISFVTVTGVICTMVAGDQTVTRVARVDGGSRNLTVINAINQLSRQTEEKHFTLAEVEKWIAKIEKLPNYSPKSVILCGALGALGFAIFFNGTYVEIGAVFIIGLVVQLLTTFMGSFEINQIFVNGAGAFACAWLAEWIHSLDTAAQVDVMIISSIMLLVPGLTLTNAIRDTVMGEYLSRVVRGSEAAVIAVSIAVGVALGLTMYH